MKGSSQVFGEDQMEAVEAAFACLMAVDPNFFVYMITNEGGVAWPKNWGTPPTAKQGQTSEGQYELVKRAALILESSLATLTKDNEKSLEYES